MIVNRLCRLLGLGLLCVVSSHAQTTTPATPAGRTLQTWLDAFNSGDREKIDAYVKTIDKSQSVDGMMSFRQQTGGFELLSIESSEPLHIRFRVKERGGPTNALGNLIVKDGQPPTVDSFGLSPLPPGAKLEDVKLDAALRKQVIEGVDQNLTEYYIEPTTAKQMVDALKMHSDKGEYDAITDGDVFAKRLTEDLQAVSSIRSKRRQSRRLRLRMRYGFISRWSGVTARFRR
jgi:retinol-binding protein 3